MAFPTELTSVLTGATTAQLASWRRGKSPLLVPEYGNRPTALYSFRDLLALRTVASLRSQVPLQRIRKAFQSLQDMDLTEHPSRYTLVTDGDSVFLVEGVEAVDLVKRPRQIVLTTLDDVFKPFLNFKQQKVVNFINPRPRLEVREARMGGWPTIAGTRVPYDTVANLVGNGDVPASSISKFFPTVVPEDVPDAVDFDVQVSEVGKAS
ncbi:DUF433 domain-containing protein [Rhodococcus hoagii]|nr:DUF433 domain-containing protein [Prescottella equi]NKT31577.1 DUF433 domain-containing protein [Prescottella equi]NKT35955.1 DUF433 domain-containing protein [Prescottella equi]NKT39270.1 DUF433 domain-containing protein [Prescottella equi]NKT75898.1 DUF433 domain-containing protein [Prescottella equi]